VQSKRGEKKEEKVKFEIKSYLNGGVLFSAETESLKMAVELAVKSKADLRWANLSSADLRWANLSSADLSWADLSSADLSSAKNLNKFLTTSLYLLLDQPGKIRAYKLVKENGEGPFNGGIIYEIGKSYEVKEADKNEATQCAAGINLATLDWCIQNWESGRRILIAEFTAKDIAAIPINSDGKFRVRKCKIVGEKNLKEIGLEGK